MSERKYRLAIQKPTRETTGKVNMGDETEILLKDGGLSFNFPSRVDITSTNIPEMQIVAMRNGDIGRALIRGDIDMGIFGLDKLNEVSQKNRLLTLKELRYSECVVMLGVHNDIPYNTPADLVGLRLATSYPRGTARWLAENGQPWVIEDEDGSFEGDSKNLVRIVKYDGGAETWVKERLADGAVEVSSTGTSMKNNNMRPVANVLESQAVLVARPEMALKQGSERIMWQFLNNMMIGLWRNYYTMLEFNYPIDKEKDVMAVTPCRESPTVTRLEKPGWKAAKTLMLIKDQEQVERDLRLRSARDLVYDEVRRVVPNIDDPEITRMMQMMFGTNWRFREELMSF